MDLQAKLDKLRQLKDKQYSIKSDLNKYKSSSSAHFINSSNYKNTVYTHMNLNKSTTLAEQFIQDNKDVYEDLINEQNRQQYINNILNTINNNKNKSNIIDDINNTNDKSNLIKIFNSLQENNSNDIEYINDVDDNESLTDIDTNSNIDSSIIDELSDISDLDSSDLSDSDEEEYSNEKESNAFINTKKIIVSGNYVNGKNKESKMTKTEAKKNEEMKRKLMNIDILKQCSQKVKDKCEKYLDDSVNKILKILKIYIVMAKNNFITVPNNILEQAFYGYKHISYDECKNLNKGDIIKVLFTYDGNIYQKDFIVNKWNYKTRKLECYYCNIEYYSNNEKIIKKSRKKINILSKWIIISKIEPYELINKFINN